MAGNSIETLICITSEIPSLVYLTFIFTFRYASSKKCVVNARAAWFVQEVASLIGPFCLILSNIKLNFRQQMTLLCFSIHYIHRSFIYPLKMSSKSKPMPILPTLLAFIFCTFNGMMQSISMSYNLRTVVEDQFNQNTQWHILFCILKKIIFWIVIICLKNCQKIMSIIIPVMRL